MFPDLARRWCALQVTHLITNPYTGPLYGHIYLRDTSITAVSISISSNWPCQVMMSTYNCLTKRMSLCAAERLDAAYQEVKDVKTVGRGIGLWGDMVVTLRNNDKIELRSLPK